MSDKVNPIPEGHHTVSPYMIIRGADRAIEFYKQAFGAVELMRIVDAKGIIRHAEISIGNSAIMLVDENEDFPDLHSPLALGGSPVHIFLYVEDVDALTAQAVAAGAKVIDEVKDAVDGDRRGGVEDPSGYTWWIATHIKDVPIAEIQALKSAPPAME